MDKVQESLSILDNMYKKREKRKKEEREFQEKLIARVSETYEFPELVSRKIVELGWEDGHSGGYMEVRALTDKYAELVEDVLKLYKQSV